MTYGVRFIILFSVLLVPLTTAHDPVHTFCDLIAVIGSDHCSASQDCIGIADAHCSDDNCACSFTFQAQACSQCIASKDSIDKYNAYLGACQGAGLAAPTITLPVQGASAVQGASTTVIGSNTNDVQFTDVAAALAHDGQTQEGPGVASASMERTFDTYIPAAPTTTGGAGGGLTGSVYRGLASTAPVAPVIPAPLNRPSNGVGVTNSTGLNTTSDASGIRVVPGTGTGSNTTSSSQAPIANDSSTVALNATRNFFSSAISQPCVRHCLSWKSQADLCNDDRCLCAGNTIHDAGVCSECVGDSGLGGQMGRCYSEFTEACQLQAVGTSATGPAANGISVAATGGTSGAVAPNPALGLDDQPAVATGNPYPVQSGQRTQPLLVTDSAGVTSSITTRLTTEIVTATAQAMIADETVVVWSGASRILQPSMALWASIAFWTLTAGVGG